MTTVGELFEKDVCRRIEPVIKATELDPAVLGHELDEYVVTPEIQEHVREFLTQYIESRPGRRPDGVCAWISGWFGSGKSHLLKCLGAVIENRDLVLPDGAKVGAAHHLLNKWSLPFETHLAELKTRVLFVNLLGYVSSDAPGLSQVIYQALIRDEGLSDIPWVAEMERRLKAMDLYSAFRDQIEAQGHTWSEVRGSPVVAMPLMAEALTKVDSQTWSSLGLAREALRAQQQLQVNAVWLGERLEEQAKAIDPVMGRLVIALDEVGLYLGNFHDRYLELKAIAENIARDSMYGKVWLVVTSQEAPEQKIPEMSARQEELAWLQDRFPLKFALTPENIDTVIKARLLKKSAAGAPAVVAEAGKAPGALATGATLRGASRHRELFEPPSAEALAETYPLLPYQVRLATEILGSLRGHGYRPEGLTGRERAMLGIAQAAICDSDLTQRSVGALVTMDQIFDGIVGDTKSVPSEHEREIRELKALGVRGEGGAAVSVQAVAKAVYLLCRVPQWVPATTENVAAALYPALGTPGEHVLESVRQGLAELEKGHYIGEQEGAHRWLTQIERTFEEDVARERVSASERRQTIQDLLREALETFRSVRFRNGIRVFEVELEADGERLRDGAHLKLKLSSAFADEASDRDRIERIESVQDKDTVWLLTDPSEDLVRLVDRSIAMKNVLGRQAAGTGENADARRQRERERDTLRHQALPAQLRECLRRGSVVAAGVSRALRPESWEQQVNEVLDERAEEVFYEFAAGGASVKDDDIGRILTWQGGALPECFRTLQVVEGDRIRQDGPLLAKLSEEILRRDAAGESLRGADLAAHFDAAPFGWDARVTRLGLAALLRNAAIQVQTGQGTFTSFRDEAARRAVTHAPTFKDARFRPAQVLTEEERKKARDLVAAWFGVAREATEEVEEALRQQLGAVGSDATHLGTRLSDLGLGGADRMKELAADASSVLGRPTVAARLMSIIEPALNERMADAIASCRRLKKFETDGLLNQADSVAKSLSALSSYGGDGVRKLRQGLSSADLPAAWPDIWSGYQSILHPYTAKYDSEHRELCRRVGEVSDSLRAQPGSDKVSAQVDAIARLACAEADPKLAAPALRCSGCSRSLSELERDLLRLGQLQAEALDLLAAGALPEGKEGLEPLSLSQSLISLSQSLISQDQLDAMVASLRAYAAKALKAGGVQVEIRATPEKGG